MGKKQTTGEKKLSADDQKAIDLIRNNKSAGAGKKTKTAAATNKQSAEKTPAPAPEQPESNFSQNNDVAMNNQPDNNSTEQNSSAEPVAETNTEVSAQNESAASEKTGPINYDDPKFQNQGKTDPMPDDVVSRGYSTQKIDPTLANTIIPEPTFEAPTVDPEQAARQMRQLFQDADTDDASPNPDPQNGGEKKESGQSSENADTGKSEPLIPANSALADATPEERRQAAEQLTEIALDTYKLVKLGAQYIAKVDDTTLIDMELDGKIDVEMMVPDTEGNDVSINDFVGDYNKMVEKEIVVKDEFIEKVREPMIRVCMKNGWGATDEQMLAYWFGRDITQTVAMTVSMKRNMNKALKLYSKMWMKQNEFHINAQNAQYAAQQQQQQPQNSQQEQYQPADNSQQQPADQNSQAQPADQQNNDSADNNNAQ